jgi:hypothetical protein
LAGLGRFKDEKSTKVKKIPGGGVAGGDGVFCKKNATAPGPRAPSRKRKGKTKKKCQKKKKK